MDSDIPPSRLAAWCRHLRGEGSAFAACLSALGTAWTASLFWARWRGLDPPARARYISWRCSAQTPVPTAGASLTDQTPQLGRHPNTHQHGNRGSPSRSGTIPLGHVWCSLGRHARPQRSTTTHHHPRKLPITKGLRQCPEIRAPHAICLLPIELSHSASLLLPSGLASPLPREDLVAHRRHHGLSPSHGSMIGPWNPPPRKVVAGAELESGGLDRASNPTPTRTLNSKGKGLVQRRN